MNFHELRYDLSVRAKKGLPLFPAGILFWSVLFITELFVPRDLVVWFYIYGMGAVFPLGILISQLLKIDLLAKGNPLSMGGGLIGAVQIFYIPLVILILLHEPSWLPFSVGLLAGSHFLPYFWLYDSKAYLFLTISTVVSAAIIQFFFSESSFLSIPILFIIIYTCTAFLLFFEVKKLEKPKTLAA